MNLNSVEAVDYSNGLIRFIPNGYYGLSDTFIKVIMRMIEHKAAKFFPSFEHLRRLIRSKSSLYWI